MSHDSKILSVLVDISSDLGSVKTDIQHMKSDIASLKKKKTWLSKIDWVKMGKGFGYIILSVAIAGGGAAGLSSWLGLFK